MYENTSERLVVAESYKQCPDCGGDVTRLQRRGDDNELLDEAHDCSDCAFFKRKSRSGNEWYTVEWEDAHEL